MNEAKVLRLKEDTKAPFGIELNKNQEIELVIGVVYMNGYPLPSEMQLEMLKWINNNPDLFLNDTRNW